MWEESWVCCLKWIGLQDDLTQNKTGFPCSDLNAGSCLISQDEGISESSVQTLEKVLVSRLISTGTPTCLWQLERNTEFNASKGDDAWLLLKTNRNLNISVATRKGPWVSRLTLRGVPIALPSLEEKPNVSVTSRQESWRCWTNTSFEGPFPL